jgi:hypothetical protein
MYLPDSNVLVTRFLSPEGVGEVVDFMPVEDPSRGERTHQIVRVVRAVRGAVRFRLECQPAFDYARRPHQITLEGRGAVFEAPAMRFSLVSRFPLARQGAGVATEFLLHPGEPSTFILRQVEGDGDSGLLEARLVGTELLTRTLEFWRRWLSKCRYRGRWREMVNRSALTLQLLGRRRVADQRRDALHVILGQLIPDVVCGGVLNALAALDELYGQALLRGVAEPGVDDRLQHLRDEFNERAKTGDVGALGAAMSRICEISIGRSNRSFVLTTIVSRSLSSPCFSS